MSRQEHDELTIWFEPMDREEGGGILEHDTQPWVHFPWCHVDGRRREMPQAQEGHNLVKYRPWKDVDVDKYHEELEAYVAKTSVY
jgi:hypothetical protein